MKTPGDWLLMITVMLNLAILGSSRLTSVIQRVSWQGMILGVLPMLLPGHAFEVRLVVLALATMLIKGMIFPRLLSRSLRDARIRREVEPMIGFVTSFAIGVVLLALSFFLTARIKLPFGEPQATSLALPVGLATLLCGLFLIIARRQAIMQVIGYLVMENGIFVMGVALAHDEPFLIEMGVLLDVFVGVFVMGIAVFHISREFDHIDVEQLRELKG